MGQFEMVQRRVWRDPEFRQLSADARLMFLWSWTNPLASICGLYQATMLDLKLALSENTRIKDIRVQRALDELSTKPLLLYDHEWELVWVVNRARHANRSPKVTRAIQRELGDMPASSKLVKAFVERYGSDLGIELGGQRNG